MSTENAPVHVTDSSFEQEVLQADVPVLVDFWAPWCAPCRMVAPVLEQIATEYSGKVKIAKMNTDENPAKASTLGIRGIPTLILFKDGKEFNRLVGAHPKGNIQSLIHGAMD